MKTKILLSTMLLSAPLFTLFSDNDPVIMRINGKDIMRSEFEYIYHKNSQQQIESPKSVSEYVDLFVNYKLKVAKAEALGCDTAAAFVSELAGYRQELAKPYLVDQQVDDSLTHVVYDRMQRYVEASHILLRLDSKATPAQEQAVLKRMHEIQSQIAAGADFNDMAFRFSEDPSAKQNRGNLGWVEPFMMVLPFEDAVYETPVGSVSEPVRTSFGYHLVKVTDETPNVGELHVAHIMKRVPRNASQAEIDEARKAIDAIYMQIEAGADFGELAKAESDDKASARRDGMLPWFSRGRMIPEFEKASFALAHEGDYSKPFLSSFGWHIARLYERKPLASYEVKKNEISRALVRDERGTMSQDVLVSRLKKEYGFALNEQTVKAVINEALQAKTLDQVFHQPLRELNAPLVNIGTGVYTTADLAQFLHNVSFNPYEDIPTQIKEQIERFASFATLDYESNRLEEKYPDFRNLLQEYRDGILLFEVSNRFVWDKAVTDEKGLERYFKKHKRDYKWDSPRYKGFAFACQDEQTAKLVRKQIKSLPTDSIIPVIDRTFNTDSTERVSVIRGLYAAGENQAFDHLAFKKGERKWAADYPEQFFYGKRQRRYPSSYEDVKGHVIADYQVYLEDNWVEVLRKESEFEVFEDVIKTVKPL